MPKNVDYLDSSSARSVEQVKENRFQFHVNNHKIFLVAFKNHRKKKKKTDRERECGAWTVRNLQLESKPTKAKKKNERYGD